MTMQFPCGFSREDYRRILVDQYRKMLEITCDGRLVIRLPASWGSAVPVGQGASEIDLLAVYATLIDAYLEVTCG